MKGKIKSWTELLPDNVYNRLCNCCTHKADIPVLLDARWQWAQDTDRDKQGYTKEDCLIYVLELLDSNGLEDITDLTSIEWENLLN